ncbi:disease resistance protein RPV1 [Ricinus communis]|uniref:disease resistance protein RPV1 n=1 Tax=Ricinus communis TaxID=3988 RepID=UPI0007722C45|nr:disease resistance protein RPV1 [Ricinus communis]|eukprot:XP_015572065.1 disease resistance-like protein DSC1 [Ricinus communis]
MASPSSASHSTHKWKYDVFLSFRGADTRQNFTSHLHFALCRKSIRTFIDDELSRGEQITPALLEVVEESRIAVIIFSKNYGSSTFCLDEVAKIIECNETHRQTVVPVFYHVDPLDVENQTGSFETAFAKHEIHNFDRVQRWKAALSKAASMAGWDSKVIRMESQLVENIVRDILEKLKQAYPCDLEGLVGIKSRIGEIKALLFAENQKSNSIRASISTKPLDVRVLGIWGMGGIGKTTLAKAVFSDIACQFEGRCFLPSVRKFFEKDDGYYIIKELLSQISRESDVKISKTDILCSPFVKRMLNRNVLVIIDDVNSPQQLDFFAENRNWFGTGSRIIVTSRDRQILLGSADDIYEIKKLGYNEAQQLFSQNAFKKTFPPEGLIALSHSYIQYANGIPLALKVLGSNLFGRTERKWKSTLEKLRQAPNKDVLNILKVSYDGLDKEEKEIFLHVVSFFSRKKKIDEVTQILDGCGFSTEVVLCDLVDKSLITISDNTIAIHDLLHAMGMEIVRQESTEPGEWSRLWDHEDILRVLTRNAGTEAIEAIFLDMSKIDEIIDLNPNVFARMSNLKLLRFYDPNFDSRELKDIKVRLSRGLDSLSSKLQYLYWNGYPSKTLPANFHPKDLVELHLPSSKLKRLPWKNMDLKKLKEIDLSWSSRLTTVPELSRATNLTCINLSDSKRIRRFPSTIGLDSLETLNLSDCVKLERFPDVSRSIRFLYLYGTAIEEVPSSVGCLSRLVSLNLFDCTKLKSLPTSICKIKSLELLCLSGCTNLKHFPEISETMDCLVELYLDGTAIADLPLSVENLKRLSSLSLSNCRNLVCLPESISKLKHLSSLDFSDCPKLEKLPEELIVSLELIARGCHLSKLASDLSGLSCLSFLDLSKTKFETLPPSIKQLSQLITLDISFCDRLESLPDLSLSLQFMYAQDCTSLTSVCGLK